MITDSHFGIRERWGRLLVFVGQARDRAAAMPAITGIGIDEKAALCVDANGIGPRVFDRPRLRVAGAADARARRRSRKSRFNFRDVPVVGIGAESSDRPARLSP